MATFLVYTSPAAGHAFPLVPGLLSLQARGHEVHLRTAPELVDGIRTAGLSAQAVDRRLPEMDADGAQRLRQGLAGLMARGAIEGRDLERAIAKTDPDVLLIDTNAYGAAVAAEASGRPWATVLPSVLPLPGKGIPPYGLGMRPMGGPLGRFRDSALFLLVERLYARAMLPGLNGLRADAGLAPLRSPIDHLLGPDRLIVLAGDPIEYPRPDLPGHVHLVGAQLWDPPAPSPAWLLEDGDPWVLVTCSTGYQGDQALAAAAIEALRDEPVRVLVTLAGAYGRDDGLPVAANARVERFVPHGPVLERAAAVVCHAGMGIVHKAMWAGVPIVAVPFGRDQPEVARRVVESGAGVALRSRRLSPARLRRAFRDSVALAPSARAASARLRAASGAARFADAAEELLAGQSPTSSWIRNSSREVTAVSGKSENTPSIPSS
jgi:UDP:flavonoid glycosyltransferase YjiC (YdhE family)